MEAAEQDRAYAQRFLAFARGEVTWAEVEGITAEQARNIAEAGCDLAAAGRLEEARVLFEGLTAINPRDAGAHAALGTVYQKLDRLQDALDAYDAALSVDAAHPVALAHRGELRLRRGDAGGLEDVARALQADPLGETAAGKRAASLVRALALSLTSKEAGSA